MPSSPYTGFTTRYGVKYKNKRIGQMTSKDGDTVCPKCQSLSELVFVDETAQLGFIFNKYFEFLHCTRCGRNYCIVMQRKEDSYND